MRLFTAQDHTAFLNFASPLITEHKASASELQKLAQLLCPILRKMLSDHHNRKDVDTVEVGHLAYNQGLLLEGMVNHQQAMAHYEEALRIYAKLLPDSTSRERINSQLGIDRCKRELQKLVMCSEPRSAAPCNDQDVDDHDLDELRKLGTRDEPRAAQPPDEHGEPPPVADPLPIYADEEVESGE